MVYIIQPIDNKRLLFHKLQICRLKYLRPEIRCENEFARHKQVTVGPPKRRQTFPKLHEVISQNRVILVEWNE